MPNRLSAETSPYLRQHAENPVDWYPWGAEALARARDVDRPILLSIGYAACHWCHVMAHESFEDPETAALMNARFVNVKVDREERPDLDAIYMQAVQSMTGHGGWPMTVFLTPDGEPFYGGTYFPPESRHGMPSFRRVLEAVADAYHSQRDRVEQTTATLRELYAHQRAPATATGTASPALLERATGALLASADREHGGFGTAPKFPQAMALDFLLRQWRRTGSADALTVAQQGFRAMARGGIYDQIGGGFHRYAVDAVWLVPHFEKMLYDNALLARLGVHLWQATGDLETRRVTEETLDWVAREMTSPEGGFYATLDADSEGEEGRYYVWSAVEFDALLGDDAPLLRAYWGVTDAGNFEDWNVLHVPEDPAIVAAGSGVSETELAAAVARGSAALAVARAPRVRPARDEKILASWNGLMLRAVAEAARAFESDTYAELARRNGAFLRASLLGDDGRVWHLGAGGAARVGGFLDDHAAVALGFLALYELTFDRSWLDDARRIADAMRRWFWDDAAGAFFDTASDAETLITRPRELTDGAVPSGTSLASELLLRLGVLLDDASLRDQATRALAMLAEPMAAHPLAFGHLLGVADLAAHGAVEVALVGEPASPDFRALATAVGRTYVPALVLAGGAPEAEHDAASAVALLAGRPMRDGRATAYVCRHYTCDAPTTDAAELRDQLDGASRAD